MKKLFPIFLALIFSACSERDETNTLFVKKDNTGIDFVNTVNDTDSLNVFNYIYMYNGAGVGIADFNNDGLDDVFFTANQSEDKLYLNKGGFKFEDISETSGIIQSKDWSTGVAVADVNGDGRNDIYICHINDIGNFNSANKLYINVRNDENGVPKFKEKANEYGVDFKGLSTHASFFDYDNDGDLDLYLLNHSDYNSSKPEKAEKRFEYNDKGDKLYRNDNNKFVDVSKESGIYSSELGYGLGIVTCDINMDGWQDIYVGNDFQENDYYFLNQKDGTFKEISERAFKHTSRFTMGVDIADFNNDLEPDVLSLDMLPYDPQILKTSIIEDRFLIFYLKLKYGYSYQFARNNLQLNLGKDRFSEIALFSGVSATDWSWSVLMEDYNLNGNKDIYITNGIVKRSNDLDYLKFITAPEIQEDLKNQEGDYLSIISKMPENKFPNFAYTRDGQYGFKDVSKDWGFHEPTFSNGAAYADLDDDGDLDLIVNNINDPAFVYENKSIEKTAEEKESPSYVKVRLAQENGNKFGLGASVIVYQDGDKQMKQITTSRGYLSSVPSYLVFGVKNQIIDSISVIWPGNEVQTIKKVEPNQKVKIDRIKGLPLKKTVEKEGIYFSEISNPGGIDYEHKENKFVEFSRERLIPHQFSQEGPTMAIADIDNDGLEDFFVGAARGKESKIYLQTEYGFTELKTPLFEEDKNYEDTDAIFKDFDNDGDLDLMVASGGNEYFGNHEMNRSRIYFYENGNFKKKTLLPVTLTGSCIAAADFDKDGDIDVYLGARAKAAYFGIAPDGYLLKNDGTGNFTEDKDIPRKLQKPGFVKDAKVADLNGDGWDDLVVVGEWMPISIYYNNNGSFEYDDNNGLKNTNGWWNEVLIEDIDNDGDLDLVSGNLGLNSKLKASKEKPVNLYVADVNTDSKIDQILTHYIGDKEYIFYTKDEIVSQINELKKKYLGYSEFASDSLREIFPNLDYYNVFKVYDFESGVFINDGNGSFSKVTFPPEVQFSPVEAILVKDINDDDIKDLILAGNMYEVNVQLGRYDANYGTVLTGNGDGTFTYVTNKESGLWLDGEIKDLKLIKHNKFETDLLLVSRNDSTMQYFQLKQ